MLLFLLLFSFYLYKSKIKNEKFWQKEEIFGIFGKFKNKIILTKADVRIYNENYLRSMEIIEWNIKWCSMDIVSYLNFNI